MACEFSVFFFKGRVFCNNGLVRITGAGQDRGIAFFQAIEYMLEGIYFFLVIEVVDGIFFELAQLLVVRFQGGFVEGGIKVF